MIKTTQDFDHVMIDHFSILYLKVFRSNIKDIIESLSLVDGQRLGQQP